MPAVKIKINKEILHSSCIRKTQNTHGVIVQIGIRDMPHRRPSALLQAAMISAHDKEHLLNSKAWKLLKQREVVLVYAYFS